MLKNAKKLWAEIKGSSLKEWGGLLKALSGALIMIIFSLAIIILPIFGWVNNIVKLTDCDFNPSYKAEIIRTVGIFVAPAGMIMGYIDIDDKSSK